MCASAMELLSLEETDADVLSSKLRDKGKVDFSFRLLETNCYF